MNYQPLFDYMQDEHGVTLLETDMQEIIRIVQGMHLTKPEPSRLEVAKDVFCALMSNKMMPNEPDMVYAINLALKGADMLIKQSKL